MNANLLVPLLITTFVAVLSWVVAHQLTAKRDLTNKRRELKVKYLIEAYRQLERASNRIEPPATWTDLESAIADIQLLGTPRQVEMAKTFADEFANNRTASLDDLLFDLRRTLRTELKLEPVESRIKYLRVTHKQPEVPLPRVDGKRTTHKA